MVKDVNLIKYLPPFLQEYREMQHIMSAENPEFVLAQEVRERILDNTFIKSCDETGIARFEKILGITVSSEDTLQSRISRVLIRWNDSIPYVWKVFLQKLQTLCGDDFEVNTDWDNYELEVITHLDLFGQVEELENMLEYIMPANIKVDAENILNYEPEGALYMAAGMAFADVFQLTDSFQVNWTLNANAGGAAIASGSCNIMLTDSFSGVTFASEAEAGASTAPSVAEQIEVSDFLQGTIQVGSAANTGSAIAFTEII